MSFAQQRLLIVGVLAVASLMSACARASQDQLAGSAQDWQSEGQVQAIDGQTWVVGSQLVDVPPQATVAGKPQVGSVVRLTGKRTANGELRADRVQVVQDAAEPAGQPTSVPVAPPAQKPTIRPRPAAPAAPVPVRRGEDGGGDD